MSRESSLRCPISSWLWKFGHPGCLRLTRLPSRRHPSKQGSLDLHVLVVLENCRLPLMHSRAPSKPPDSRAVPTHRKGGFGSLVDPWVKSSTRTHPCKPSSLNRALGAKLLDDVHGAPATSSKRPLHWGKEGLPATDLPLSPSHLGRRGEILG